MLTILRRKYLVPLALVQIFQNGTFHAFIRNLFSVMKMKSNYKKFKQKEKYHYEKKTFIEQLLHYD